MKRLTLALAATIAFGVAATGQILGYTCADCRTARIWQTTSVTFPEACGLNARRHSALDLGIAFSGGGTRSGSATLGQLRGLSKNGWLKKARYITAVSGGAWAAVPYTFTEVSDDELLGSVVAPEQVDCDALNRTDGRLTAAIGASKLPMAGFKELMGRLPSMTFSGDAQETTKKALNHVLNQREAAHGERTYSRSIGDAFIDPVIDPKDKQASRRLFSWDDESVEQAVRDNPGEFSHIQFITSDARQRPFLIIGGTVVSAENIYASPLLMPIEFTALYTGIRHRFGEKFGGIYVSSWAYDRTPAGPATAKTLTVHLGKNDRRFTIADVAAASSAAPALPALLLPRAAVAPEWAATLPEWARNVGPSFASLFPSFRHFTVQSDNGVIVSAPGPHWDGGYLDNFGLMPLLARGVKNIIVFANVNNEYDKNDDLASYFEAIQPDFKGDKSHNRVFEQAGYNALKRQYREDRIAGRPLVYCGTDWKVLRNVWYEIQPYSGVSICWVYLHAVPGWSERIRDPVLRELLADHRNVTGEKAHGNAHAVSSTDAKDAKGSDTSATSRVKSSKADQAICKERSDFETFPWYDTFKQLKLNKPQVNLLANLTSWVITNPDVVERISKAIPCLRNEASLALTRPECIGWADDSSERE